MSELTKSFEYLVDFALRHGNTPRSHTEFGEIYRETRKLIDDLEAYADKLAAGLPEGMLPKDIELMREANMVFAQQVQDLNAKCSTMFHALEFYADEGNYPDDIIADSGDIANHALAQSQMPDSKR